MLYILLAGFSRNDPFAHLLLACLRCHLEYYSLFLHLCLFSGYVFHLIIVLTCSCFLINDVFSLAGFSRNPSARLLLACLPCHWESYSLCPCTTFSTTRVESTQRCVCLFCSPAMLSLSGPVIGIQARRPGQQGVVSNAMSYV